MNKRLKNQITLITCFFVAFSVLTSCEEKSTIEKANDLTVSEGFKNPLGFYDATPTFSWKLPVTDGVKHQSAYQIVVASSEDLLPDNADLWDSGKQMKDQSIGR